MTESSLKATGRGGKPVIGLAGGIGAGKSQVAALLQEMGAEVIDSDRMVHEELSDPEVVETFCGWWGERVRDPQGGIDRAVMADIIFRDPTQRVRMEEFLYPRLEVRRNAIMKVLHEDAAVVAIVLDIPLLFEFGLDRLCHTVVFVECDRALRHRRLAEARGWSPQEVERREKLQKPLDSKREAADHKVVNNSTIDALRPQVEAILAQLSGGALVR